ncbi:uncharacterized [Tachysurus ichikawai]
MDDGLPDVPPENNAALEGPLDPEDLRALNTIAGRKAPGIDGKESSDQAPQQENWGPGSLSRVLANQIRDLLDSFIQEDKKRGLFSPISVVRALVKAHVKIE